MRRLPLERILVVCGMPCAGKTTAGQIFARKYDFKHFEASDVMHKLYAQMSDGLESVDQFALRQIKKQPLVLPEIILESATKASDRHIVITGLRSPDEVAILLSIPSFKLILVAANVKVRYERSRLRAREDHVVSFEEFKRRDEVQREMGVERIAQVYAPLTIANDGTLQDYERQLLAVVTE